MTDTQGKNWKTGAFWESISRYDLFSRIRMARPLAANLREMQQLDFSDRDRFGNDLSFLKPNIDWMVQFMNLIEEEREMVLLVCGLEQHQVVKDSINGMANQSQSLINANNNTQTGAQIMDNAIHFTAQFNRFYSIIGPAFLRYQENSVDMEEEKARTKSHLEEIEKIKHEAKFTLESIRSVSAKAGVSKNAEAFRQLADTLHETKKKWLGGAMILAVSAIALGGYFSFFDVPGEGAYFAYLPRIGLVAMLVTAALWCGSVYRRMNSDYYAHRHRQTILQSFKAFHEGADSSETKDAVLQEAMRAAFQISGDNNHSSRIGNPNVSLSLNPNTSDGGVQ